jgi:activator of 2-hydroxyglutaryl-CoA dehydratase
MIFAGVDVGVATAKTVILSEDRVVSYSIVAGSILASDAAEYIAGFTLFVDGGLLLGRGWKRIG